MADRNKRGEKLKASQGEGGRSVRGVRGRPQSTTKTEREAVIHLARGRVRSGWYDAEGVLAATIDRILPKLDD